MNICRLANKLEKYNSETLGVHGTPESEVSLGYFIFNILVAIFLTVVLNWWLIPLKIIYKKIISPILNKKFKCDKV
jgi:hypothetical protein